MESNGSFPAARVGLRARLPCNRGRGPRGRSANGARIRSPGCRAPSRPARPLLADDPGVDSGYMMAQYHPGGLSCPELKRLAVPASESIRYRSRPCRRSHVSMGWASGPQTAARGRRPDPGRDDRAARRRPLAGSARPPGARRGDRPRAVRRCCAARPAPDRTGTSAPEIDAAVAIVASGRCVAGRGRCRDRAPLRLRHDLSEPAAARCACAAERVTHGRADARAPRWQTEAPLRMLMNNLDPEVAERPDDLVVYGGTGRAARDWRVVRRASCAR